MSRPPESILNRAGSHSAPIDRSKHPGVGSCSSKGHPAGFGEPLPPAADAILGPRDSGVCGLPDPARTAPGPRGCGSDRSAFGDRGGSGRTQTASGLEQTGVPTHLAVETHGRDPDYCISRTRVEHVLLPPKGSRFGSVRGRCGLPRRAEARSRRTRHCRTGEDLRRLSQTDRKGFNSCLARRSCFASATDPCLFVR